MFYLAFISYVSSYPFAPLAILLITISETLPQILQIALGTVADFQKNRVRKNIVFSFVKFLLYTGVGIILTSSKFSLLSVVLICLINFISDTLGQFTGFMLTPI
ncbi:hypothetical protein AB1I63_06755 [Streptococcus pneumoniae]